MPPETRSDEAIPEQKQTASEHELRELYSTWVAEFSVLVMVFPLLDFIMKEGESSLRQTLVGVLAPLLAMGALALAGYIRVGRWPWQRVRSSGSSRELDEKANR